MNDRLRHFDRCSERVMFLIRDRSELRVRLVDAPWRDKIVITPKEPQQMSRLFGAFGIAIAVLTASTVAQTSDPRLTIADVEKVTGLKGLQQLVPGAVPGAGAGFNFAGPDKHMVLMVNFGPAALYQHAKEQKTYAGVPMPLFHADVPGIGDEAFDSPPGSMQYVLYVRKGANAASFTSYYISASKATLTMERLKAIAKIAAGRM